MFMAEFESRLWGMSLAEKSLFVYRDLSMFQTVRGHSNKLLLWCFEGRMKGYCLMFARRHTEESGRQWCDEHFSRENNDLCKLHSLYKAVVLKLVLRRSRNILLKMTRFHLLSTWHLHWQDGRIGSSAGKIIGTAPVLTPNHKGSFPMGKLTGRGTKWEKKSLQAVLQSPI